MNDQQARWSYLPGEWYAVLGADLAVLLPPGERSRAAAVWELVDAGAATDEVLDALLAGGLRALPSFALVGGSAAAARVVVRGEARATVEADGATELSGADAASWVDRVFADVSAVLLDSGTEPAAGARELTAGPGLLRVARLVTPGGAAAGAQAGGEPEAAPAPPVPPAPPAAPPTTPPTTPPEPPTGPIAQPDPGPVSEPTPVSGLPGVPDLPPVPPPPVGGAVPPIPVPPPPGTPVAWSPEDDHERDHDGHTHQPGYDPDSFARSQPGIPGQPPAPSRTRPVARLHVSNGEVVEVDRVILLGRAPEARRFSATEQPRLVTVPSPHHEISSTHLEIRPGSGADHGSAVVTDLGSTNGSVLVQPGLPPEPLQPGIPVQLLPGAVVDLGDGVTIQVTNP